MKYKRELVDSQEFDDVVGDKTEDILLVFMMISKLFL
jgi:hypothetical protein